MKWPSQSGSAALAFSRVTSPSPRSAQGHFCPLSANFPAPAPGAAGPTSASIWEPLHCGLWSARTGDLDVPHEGSQGQSPRGS